MNTKLSDVTEADLGQWVAGATTYNPVEFNIAIVELAIRNGFELDGEAWEADKPKFLAGDATYDMIEDLGYISDEALACLNGQLPDWYYFDFDDGLVLYHDVPDAEVS
jgi:hypothetical protein